MTTPLNTITSLLPRLTAEQLQTIENYVGYFYRQNLANNIAALPTANLVGLGTVLEIFTNPGRAIVIPPPPPAQNIVPPPPPLLENAVPRPLLPDLPPSPLVIAESDFDNIPTPSARRSSVPVAPLNLTPGEWYRSTESTTSHPQLKPLSPEITCRGCLDSCQPDSWAHTYNADCCCAEEDHDQEDYEYDEEDDEEDYDYEEDPRLVTRDNEA